MLAGFLSSRRQGLSKHALLFYQRYLSKTIGAELDHQEHPEDYLIQLRETGYYLSEGNQKLCPVHPGYTSPLPLATVTTSPF